MRGINSGSPPYRLLYTFVALQVLNGEVSHPALSYMALDVRDPFDHEDKLLNTRSFRCDGGWRRKQIGCMKADPESGCGAVDSRRLILGFQREVPINVRGGLRT